MKRRKPPGARRSDFGGKLSCSVGRRTPVTEPAKGQVEELALPIPGAATASFRLAGGKVGSLGAPSGACAGSASTSGAEPATGWGGRRAESRWPGQEGIRWGRGRDWREYRFKGSLAGRWEGKF